MYFLERWTETGQHGICVVFFVSFCFVVFPLIREGRRMLPFPSKGLRGLLGPNPVHTGYTLDELPAHRRTLTDGTSRCFALSLEMWLICGRRRFPFLDTKLQIERPLVVLSWSKVYMAGL